jgi:hypothetical protein
MRAHDATHGTGWSTPTRAAAVVGLTVSLTACGTSTLRQSGSSSTSRLVVRQVATSPLRAEIEIDCSTPPTTSGAVGIASANAQRFTADARPHRDWVQSLAVSAGSTCTVTDRPAPPATLLAVSGGTEVRDGGRLTGVSAPARGGDTVTLGLVAGVAP